MINNTHLLIDCFNCEETFFSEKSLRELAKLINLTSLEYTEHIFVNKGMTAVLLLKESHISFHSYPEFNYVAVDVFSCRKLKRFEKVRYFLASLFKPKEFVLREITRGDVEFE